MEFHEVANLFPLIEGQAFDELVTDIREHGLQQPIWTYQDKIIDGRNRYRACLEANVEPRYQEWDCKGSLISFAVSMNIRRRHLDSSQRAMIAVRSLPLYEAESAKRHGGDHKSEEYQDGKNSILISGASVGLAAKDFGTNEKYVQHAKDIMKHAPELEEHIANGTITLPDAKAIANLPKESQSAIVEQATKKKEQTGRRVSKPIKDAIKEEKTKVKKEQITEQAKTIILPNSIQLLPPGDFMEIGTCIQDNSVSLIFTDPPYQEEQLLLWTHLSSFAQRVLTPGGILLAYSGQLFLPKVLDALTQHLEYCWLLGVQHTGGHIQIWKHTLWNDWKPIVMFSKGEPLAHDWLMDLYRGDKGDKAVHEWSQGEGEAAYFIEKLTKPGQLIVDPMCGSGTILRAAHKLHRHSIGIEVDQDRHASALGGMKGLSGVGEVQHDKVTSR